MANRKSAAARLLRLTEPTDPRKLARAALLAAVSAVCSAPALAGTADLGDGLEAVWSINTSLTSGWRMKDPDMELIGVGDGGTGSAYTQSADKNFAKGDNFTTLLRAVGDINIHKGNFGGMLRAKVWDNYRLTHGTVPLGAQSNAYAPDSKLDDSQFDTNLSKFRGAELLDAYVYGGFDLAEEVQGKLRLGQHVVNFGESLFVPGVNQYSVFDVNALRQAGTLLKEAMLPVPQVSLNLGLPGNASFEAFYQFEWKRTSIDGCGTYWSPATAFNCTKGSTVVAQGNATSQEQYNGVPAFGGLNTRFSLLEDKTPSNDGQFGLALKKTVEAIDTELGAYYVNYKTHVPNLSGVRDNTTVANSYYYTVLAGQIGGNPGSVFWDYDTRKDIKVFGLSAATVLGGWSVAGELSHTKDYPVQTNPVDGFYAVVASIGPMAPRWGFAAAPLGSGTYMEGRDYKDKTQLQVSTVKLFSNVLGASSGSFLGEVAMQKWSGMGDPYTGVRYGRGFEFGAAQHESFGGTCPAAATNANNCTLDGYFTSSAWGVRALAELEYPGLIPGVLVKPRLFISKDVKGWSADSNFSEGRHVIAAGVKFDYAKRFTLDLSYTTFNSNARFDSFHDRDFAALVLGASF